MHPGMTHYPQGTPVRVPDIANKLYGGWRNALAGTERHLAGNMNALLASPRGYANWPTANSLVSMMNQPGQEVPPEMMNQVAERAMDFVQPMAGLAGMTAWHGSPHLFDRFKMSQVGTGEGAQAYGHGLYLAEAPGVARTYKLAGEYPDPNAHNLRFNAIGEDDSKNLPGWVAQRISNSTDPSFEARSLADDFRNRLETAKANYITSDTPWVETERVNAIQKTLGSIENIASNPGFIKAAPKEGHLYKVDIPDEHVAKMLDWDKPLSDQPESVRNALSNMPSGKRVSDMSREELIDSLKYVDSNGVYDDADSIAEFGRPATLEELRSSAENVDLQYYLDTDIGADPYATGKSLYKQLTSKFGGGNAWSNEAQAKASEYLNSLGVPGIRYLDAPSRGAGDGTRNMVLFDEGLATILERNSEKLAP